MGGLYAREQGEPEQVWRAIYEQYKPVSMEDSIPATPAGRLLSLADKLDTLRGCFRVGMIPTRLERSVRAAPRGAGRGEDPGGRQARPLACKLVGRRRRRLRRFPARAHPLLLQGHSRLRLRRSERRAGGGLRRSAGCRRAPRGAHRRCGRRRTSNRWRRVSSGSRTSCGRPSSPARGEIEPKHPRSGSRGGTVRRRSRNCGTRSTDFARRRTTARRSRPSLRCGRKWIDSSTRCWSTRRTQSPAESPHPSCSKLLTRVFDDRRFLGDRRNAMTMTCRASDEGTETDLGDLYVVPVHIRRKHSSMKNTFIPSAAARPTATAK